MEELPSRLACSPALCPAIRVLARSGPDDDREHSAGMLMVWVSARYDDAWRTLAGPWSYIRPDGARAILATIAGSMITVAGVTFSVTTLAVSHATSNFGPRLFARFLKDRGSQVTLGTFVATFVYSLIVLAIISDGDDQAVFVPHLAIVTAFLLSLAGVCMLIFFVQHAQDSLYISNIIADLGTNLADRIEEIFPRQLGSRAEADGVQLPPATLEVRAARSGYLQHAEGEAILELASSHDVVVELLCSPGQFVLLGQPLLKILSDRPPDSALGNELRNMLHIGLHRTPEQDVMFVVDQLSQVGIRALSPGVNDPFTANTCLDWLINFVVVVSKRNEVRGTRLDTAGTLRVVSPTTSYADVLHHALEQVRPYACANFATSCHAIPALARLDSACYGTAISSAVQEHLSRWRATITEQDWSKTDRHELDKLYEKAQVTHG